MTDRPELLIRQVDNGFAVWDLNRVEAGSRFLNGTSPRWVFSSAADLAHFVRLACTTEVRLEPPLAADR